MGCCFSRSAGPNSPYPGGAPNSSARHVTPLPLTLPEGVQANGRSNGRAPSHHRHRRRDPGPLDQHINKPLRRHQWTSEDRHWTRRELNQERAEFFDTRVTGRPEVWQTIHAALQVLWDPTAEDSNNDGLDGLGNAQSILSAAEISLPTGDLVNGVYDSLGNYYQLPPWIVADPANISESEGIVAKDLDVSNARDKTISGHDGCGNKPGMRDSDGMRGESGKGVLDEREQVNVRARLSESGRDVQITVRRGDTVHTVIRDITTATALPSSKTIRVAYMGKILKETLSLEAQGWQADHIVNALVFDR